MRYCELLCVCAPHLCITLAYRTRASQRYAQHANHPHPNLSSERRCFLPPLIREVTAPTTALFNSLTIFRQATVQYLCTDCLSSFRTSHSNSATPPASFHSRPHLLSVNAPPNISAPDLRDGDSRYRHSFIRPDSSAAVVRQGCRPASGRCRRHPAVNGDTFGIRTSICLRVPSPCRSSLC